MLLAIISDIHDNLPNLQKALKAIKQRHTRVVLCTGDLTNRDTLKVLATEFTGPIYIVQGNGCNYTKNDLAKHFNIHDLGRNGGTIKLDSEVFGLCHEPKLITNLIKNTKQEPKIIFYGHTHKPWEETNPTGIKLINSGNLSNTHYPPTFAFYKTTNKKLELILVNEL
ncbi:hypothetical protein COT94_00830 [Candidatus Falkowbacteria bacterium CG10_big_fil_rev_8_21_14_0_10_37_14]|uniref:Calcineurin-like phosphoesterase domain-containing protein n=1 Tax=Candidatus Falkowbacteria bacterium CG10_big_fil_rev_8_21_14_0_10_37_14 TaxID=1974561 RepID=A0A2M6WUG6_9BACT|nr:metallophosphoesterase family protein [Candidatus Falkowbacteria bacterium]PIT96366.1 MAG: hypothetical protein COT94_00830 [Candidatus Falkowbacteria bacterium CG10_big_fil_rev_8_21_14_0_10_37_14]